MTPLRRALGWSALAPYRRSFGLAAFGYACLHVATYFFLDQGLDWRAVLDDVVKRPYVTAGFAAFACLLPLAATSTRAALRRLGGPSWRRLHRLAYLAGGAAVVHFLWLVKADLREPALYGAALSLLLAARVVDPKRALEFRPARPGGAR